MAAQSSSTNKPIVEKEIRFAVVMYGGVSLAIYINGVAQELYKMVRSTARVRNADGSLGDYVIKDPESTEAVYRMLGEQLRSRFVVDILSGTSAGGINAIFLAKALANSQLMNQLEDLWVTEGNIDLLINDSNSFADLGSLQMSPPPRSLLNSQRMYYRLLEAFDGMDGPVPRRRGEASPFVDELDLYVTATDIRGLWLPVPLADTETHEYRYRTVFRFYHSTVDAQADWSQDFLKENNPFLAFAARATSSFPFAFEPIKLKDVDVVLKAGDFLPKDVNPDQLRDGWARFYKEYKRQVRNDNNSDGIDFHSFGDGGYLDNKPFSYITETLLRRRADTPVDRRLFYIEPAPEHQKQKSWDEDDRPDAVENVMAALVSLPRYETIRDDLLQLRERNELIERTNTILRQIERTRGRVAKSMGVWGQSGSDWARKYLDQILSEYGAGYAAYHQLRVADTLDELAAAVARNLGLEEAGASFNALRQICEEWKKRKYSPCPEPDHLSENDLLYRLDLRWRVRRLFFLLHSIDDILLGLGAFRTDTPGADLSVAEPAKGTEALAEELEQREQAKEVVENSGMTWSISSQEMENQYFEALSWIKRDLNDAYGELRVRGRKLRSRNLAADDPELATYVQALQPLREIKDQLPDILRDDDKLAKACDDLEALSLELASRPAKEGEWSTGYLSETMFRVSKMCKRALGIASDPGEPAREEPLPAEVPQAILKSVQDCLVFYYEHFEYFDMLTFPITYATPIGESDTVDVYRISPEDAKELFDSQKISHPKLAGTKLGNFGAFFKTEWRKNDIMWGRLDGVERIISTLLPDSPKRSELLLKAWLTILREKLDPANLQRLHDRLGSSWVEFENAEQPSAAQMEELHERLKAYFVSDYEVDLQFSPEVALNVFGRAVNVIGSLFDGLREKHRGLQKLVSWFTRLGRVFAGIVRVSIPGSQSRLVFQRWLIIAYIAELLLILAGALLGFNNIAMYFGVFSFLITLGIDLLLRRIGSYITAD